MTIGCKERLRKLIQRQALNWKQELNLRAEWCSQAEADQDSEEMEGHQRRRDGVSSEESLERRNFDGGGETVGRTEGELSGGGRG